MLDIDVHEQSPISNKFPNYLLLTRACAGDLCALRAEDAVSGWNDPRDLRSTGFHCKIGGADSEAESEPGALAWGFRSGRPSVEQPLA